MTTVEYEERVSEEVILRKERKAYLLTWIDARTDGVREKVYYYTEMLRKNPVTLLIGRQKSKANLLSYLGVKLINVGKRSFIEKLHKFN